MDFSNTTDIHWKTREIKLEIKEMMERKLNGLSMSYVLCEKNIVEKLNLQFECHISKCVKVYFTPQSKVGVLELKRPGQSSSNRIVQSFIMQFFYRLANRIEKLAKLRKYLKLDVINTKVIIIPPFKSCSPI